MLAITISCARDCRSAQTILHRTCSSATTCLTLFPPAVAVLLLVSTGYALAQTPLSETHARQLFNAARARFISTNTNAAAAWQFGSAAFDLAEFLHDNEQLSAVATEGADA